MLKIHHLGHSPSERVIWLCEELELKYELKKYVRDPVTQLSPPELTALHACGSMPVIEVGEVLLAESAAVVDFVLARYGRGRLRLAPEHPDFAQFLYWFHFANGNLQPAIFRAMLANRGLAPDDPLRASVQEQLAQVLAFVDERLTWSPYLAGRELTAADIMSVFSLTTMRRFHSLDLAPYASIRAYLQRIAARPAYRRAMAMADPEVAAKRTKTLDRIAVRAWQKTAMSVFSRSA